MIPEQPASAYEARDKYGPQEAATYDTARAVEPLWHEENAYVKAYFAAASPRRVLDAPVGTGRFLPYYGANAEVSGIDVSEQMLIQARRRVQDLGLRNVELATGDVLKLAFPTGHFDCVVSWRFLHLLPARLLAPALAELGRVCSGELLVQAYVAPPLWRRLANDLRRFMRRVPAQPQGTAWSHIRAYYHPEARLVGAVRRAGLRVVGRDRLSNYGDAPVWVFRLRAAGRVR